MVAKGLQLIIWRKDERNVGKSLHILELSGNGGSLARFGQSKKIPRMLKKNGYHIYNRKQSQKQRENGITTMWAENSENLSIPKIKKLSKTETGRQEISEADARHRIFVFCIVHSCIITCIPSSKILPPGRLLNFTWNSLGELSKITFTSTQINPLNVSLSEKNPDSLVV